MKRWLRSFIGDAALPVEGLRVLVAGTAIRQVLVLAAAPVISRLYTPDDFGVLAVFSAIVLTALPIASLRYELAVPIAQDDVFARAVASVALAVLVVMSSLVAFVVWLAGDSITTTLQAQDLRPYLWLIPVTLFAGGMVQILRYAAIRDRRYKTVAGATARQAVGNAVVSIAGGALTGGPLGLLAGMTVGRVAGLTSLWRQVGRSGLRPTWTDAGTLRRAARRFVDFPRFSAWVGLSNNAAIHLMPLFLAGVYGTRVAGWHLFATRVIQQPMAVVGEAVSQLYLGESSNMRRSSAQTMLPLFTRTVKTLTVVSIVLFLPVGLLGGPVFAFVFGEEWRQAGTYAQIFAPMFAAQFVISPLSQTMTIVEAQRTQFYFVIGRVSVLVALLAMLAQFEASAIGAVVGFSAFTTLAYLYYLWLSYRTLRDLDGTSLDAPHPEA